MADQPFKTEFTADTSQYNAKMDEMAQKSITDFQRIQSAARENFYQLGQNAAEGLKKTQGAFDTVKEGVKALRGVIAAGAGALSGALFVKKFADDAVKASLEAEKLASILGITTKEAVALKVALSDIGSDTDTYTGAVSKLTINLRENEERMNALGVKTRDANGHLLSTDRIMQNAFSALMQFKEGTDRNLASTEMFGKSWAEVQRLMKLTPAAMDEARAKAESLETTIGVAGVERAERYRKAMDDVKDVIEAMGNRIAQALMPVLSDVGEWFAAAGPAAIVIIRGAVGGLVAVWHGLANAVTIVWQLVKAFLFNVTEPMVGFGEAMALAVSGKFAEAGNRLKQITPNVKAAWEGAWDEIVKSSESRAAKLRALFDPTAEQGAAGKPTGGNKRYTGEIKGSRVSQWDAALAAQRDAYDRMMLEQGSFEQFSKQQESAYWKNILDTVRMNKEELAAVSKKYYDVEREIRKTAFDAEIAGVKAQLEYHKQGAAERIAILDRIAEKTRERFGAESKEAKQAMAEVAQARREHAEREIQLMEVAVDRQRSAALSRIDLERENLETLEALGAISADKKLARLRELKEQEFQIELAAAQSRAQLIENDVVAYAQAMARIEEIKQKHKVDLAKIDRDISVESFRPWRQLFDSIVGGFSSAIKGVIQGTQTLGQAVRNIFQTLVLSIIDLGMQMLARWLLNTIMARAAEKVTAISQVASNAAIAASAAFASTAAIPIVGPALAPEAAAAAYAGTMAWMGAIPAARGGWDVPQGVNPVTQIHGGEMVLPEELANRVRDMTGGDGGDVHLHLHGPAYDPRGMERFFRNNASILRPALRKLGKGAN